MTYVLEQTSDNLKWAALADPTRRAVFEFVATKPQSVQSIADRLPISRPAVSQHLKQLDDAGLVRGEKLGRQRIYTADPSSLAEIRNWLDLYWSDAMNNFAKEADKDEGDKHD